MSDADDRGLLERIAARDKVAFETFFRAHEAVDTRPVGAEERLERDPVACGDPFQQPSIVGVAHCPSMPLCRAGVPGGSARAILGQESEPGLKASASEFMQYRCPVGAGPSSKT